MGDILTYEALREFFRREKQEKSLVVLPDDFVKKVRTYLKEKKEFIEQSRSKEDNVFSKTALSKASDELYNAEKVVKELFSLRVKKMFQIITRVSFLESEEGIKGVLDFEKQFFDSTVKLLNEYYSHVNNKLIESMQNCMARILNDLPQFQWAGMVYGPFKKEDLVNLPKEIVELLVKQKNALEVDV